MKNTFLNFIEQQKIIFRRVKEYVDIYEKDATSLEIIYITGVSYDKFSKTITIRFKDHREQFDFKIELNPERSKILMLYINDPELFNNSNKFNL